MSMRELSYRLSFNTPAFLGNAEQQVKLKMHWLCRLYRCNICSGCEIQGREK